MQELYLIPTVVLLTMLVSVFAALYARSHASRHFLWFLGWVFVCLHLIFLIQAGTDGWSVALKNSSMEIAALMFLGSISPQSFGKRFRIYYVAAFAVPLVLYSFVAALYPAGGAGSQFLLSASVLAALGVALVWSLDDELLPAWFAVGFSLVTGAISLWLTFHGYYEYVLRFAHSGISIMTAILFLAAYRRWSAGVLFTAAGLILWGMPVFFDHGMAPDVLAWFYRGMNLVKVLTAVGMIVLVLEDQLHDNEAGHQREQRVRLELEEYSRLNPAEILSSGIGPGYDRLCETVTRCSRFRQAVFYVRSAERNYYVAGKAGVSDECHAALERLGRRFTAAQAEAFHKSQHVKSEGGSAVYANLRSIIPKGDSLEDYGYLKAYILPMTSRSGVVEGGLMLNGLEHPSETLHADDLLPLELLMAQCVAANERQHFVKQMTQSQKLAGLGQLAGGVAHELNNPLTAVLGFAELLEEGGVDDASRHHAGVIRQEARRMKQIVESLARFWKPSPTEHTSLCLREVIQDMERLKRHDLERRKIQLHVRIAQHVPRIRGNGSQLRQLFLQLLNNAIAAVEENLPDAERRVNIDLSHSSGRAHIVVSDSGPGFPDPARIFDPFFTTRQPGEGTGLGLSLCYAVVREHGGEITAANLHPRGAAIVIDIPNCVETTSKPVEESVLA